MSSTHEVSSKEGTFQCPCCSNPWARAVGEEMMAQLCGECLLSTTSTTPVSAVLGIDPSNFDPSQDKTQNFYLWANGNWMKRNPIPAGYPSWNTFTALNVESQERCKELLDSLNTTPVSAEEGSNSIKLARFYNAAMDEAKIEQLGGFLPLEDVFQLVDRIVEDYQQKRWREYAQGLARLDAAYGVSVFFNMSAGPDFENSDHSLCQLSQGGLGLPDRDYYFDEDKEEHRKKFTTHIQNTLNLLQGEKPGGKRVADSAAQLVLELESKLAEKHFTRTENRDPHATYHKMTLADWLDQTKEHPFAWDAYLDFSTNNKELGEINVRQPEALKMVALLATTVEPETLRNYLRFHVIKSYSPYLSSKYVNENFEFYEKTLSGTNEIKPRWKRVMGFTESALGEALGELYCQKYFDESSKDRALAIVEQVRQALEDRLKEVDWIKSEGTRQEALKKMSKFRVKIGYPDKWIDYSNLQFEESDSFATCVKKSRAFHHQRIVREMNEPTDREKWFMTPQTVNAYYHPSLNEIVFPAAILQPPFFNSDADDAVNFGAMGCVVGHEMTHGFDDKGRKFNYNGILKDWWTEDDAKEYESRVQVMVNQANQYEVYGKSVNGKLTSGENIADLGGLRLALRALRNTPNFSNDKKIDGLTPTQRFFISWASCWRQNVTKERALQLLTLDPHGPNEMRCNGPLSNMPEFHEAFEIPSDSPMVKPGEVRVDIW